MWHTTTGVGAPKQLQEIACKKQMNDDGTIAIHNDTHSMYCNVLSMYCMEGKVHCQHGVYFP